MAITPIANVRTALLPRNDEMEPLDEVESSDSDWTDELPRDLGFKSRLGNGVYGIVYHARGTVGGRMEDFAIKRNVADNLAIGAVAIREMDVIRRLQGHPNIVESLGFFFTKRGHTHSSAPPFPFTEPVGRRFNYRDADDRIHFMLRLESGSLESLPRKQSLPIRSIAAQLLLALEWMHGRDIIHRDLKPGNILQRAVAGDFQIRVCDFGLSGNKHSFPSGKVGTGGMATFWYRAPEICLDQPYDEKIDIWGAAMVIYEAYTKEPFMCKLKKDSPQAILAHIFSRVPELAHITTIYKVAGGTQSAVVKKASALLTATEREAIQERFTPADRRIAIVRRLSAIAERDAPPPNPYVPADERVLLLDLIASMIEFDPERRPSATDLLNTHPYFQDERTQSLIRETRAGLPSRVLPLMEIRPCARRKRAASLLTELWNKREQISWYNHQIMFHTFEILDRFFAASTDESADSESHRDTFLKVYTVLYLMYKYFSSLTHVVAWSSFAPAVYNTPESIKEAVEFEEFIIRDICQYQLFQPTVYEVAVFAENRISENSIRDLLQNLARVTEPWEGSVRQQYRLFAGETSSRAWSHISSP